MKLVTPTAESSLSPSAPALTDDWSFSQCINARQRKWRLKYTTAKERLTSWLWTHSPDRHRGVAVVWSKRTLRLESTSSVGNERLLILQVHQRKKGKTILTTEDNSSGEVQSIDNAPTRLLVDRSTSSTDPPAPFLTFGHHSTTERFWNLPLLNLFEWHAYHMRRPCIVPGNRKKVHQREGESLKTPRIGPGVEWRRKASADRNVYDAYASRRNVSSRRVVVVVAVVYWETRVTKTKRRNRRNRFNRYSPLQLRLFYGCGGSRSAVLFVDCAREIVHVHSSKVTRT